MFFYAQLLERFKVDKWLYGFEETKAVFETELCTNDDHVIAKIYGLRLKYETEEQVKKCIIKWARNFGHDIQMEQ